MLKFEHALVAQRVCGVKVPGEGIGLESRFTLGNELGLVLEVRHNRWDRRERTRGHIVWLLGRVILVYGEKWFLVSILV